MRKDVYPMRKDGMHEHDVFFDFPGDTPTVAFLAQVVGKSASVHLRIELIDGRAF